MFRQMIALVVLAAVFSGCTYVTEVEEPAPAPQPAPVVVAPTPKPKKPTRVETIYEEDTTEVIKEGTVVD